MPGEPTDRTPLIIFPSGSIACSPLRQMISNEFREINEGCGGRRRCIRRKGDEMSAVTHMTEKDLLEVVPPFITPGSSAMIRLLELPPETRVLHRHSGPVFGYVLEGEMLFEPEGQAPYPIKAGEAFWEPGGDVIHYTVANLLADNTSRFIGFMPVPLESR